MSCPTIAPAGRSDGAPLFLPAEADEGESAILLRVDNLVYFSTLLVDKVTPRFYRKKERKKVFNSVLPHACFYCAT